MVKTQINSGVTPEEMKDLFAYLPNDVEGQAQLFTSRDQWITSIESRAYAHYMRRAWEDNDLSARAILCIDGRPTVYFKNVQKYDPSAEARAQQALWNQGMATMLVVSDPNQVRIYSGFVQPKQLEKGHLRDDLENRLVSDALERSAFALQINQWFQRIQTGQYYRDHAEKFKPDQVIDQSLLRNLSATSDALCNKTAKKSLERPVAHALLGRILFVCYLCDREIIDAEYFLKETGIRNISNLRDLLNHSYSEIESRDRLYRLFGALQEDFHGSLLNEDLTVERELIQEEHISILRHLLNGDEVASGQLSLFPIYNFKMIPIETISGIYESFISAENINSPINEDTADDSADVESINNQSESGAFYTPRHLAEMAVDSATRGWDSLLDKKCLDPACGSGIFLVVLFNRMAEEWSLKNSKANNIERAAHLRELLINNLCGVDVHQTACNITCFSLYLAFFDQLMPPDILELKSQLISQGDKVLPLLLGTEERGFGGQVSVSRSVIFAANFFESSANLFRPGLLGQFDLVIGNPPWKGRNQSIDTVMAEWLWSEENPFIAQGRSRKKNSQEEGLPSKVARSKKQAVFFPQNQSAIAFMWKVPTHLKPNGRACLVLPSRVFLNKTDEFQSAWLRNVSIDRVIQLADYRFVLFENAICPTTIVTFSYAPPKDGDQIIAYDTPQVELIDPRHAVIPISPDDQKQLTVGDVVTAADQKWAGVFWKSHFRGTGRDLMLLNRLQRMPMLGEIADEAKENKRWVKGPGFQPTTKKANDKPQDAFWKKSDWFLDATSKFDLFLFESDCTKIGERFPKLHRPRDRETFKSPLVVMNKGFSKIAFSDFPVLFRDGLHSISGPQKDRNLLIFLSGVLNSPLPMFFLFHTSANLGIERNNVHLDELHRLPFPLPEQTKNSQKSRDIVRRVVQQVEQSRDSLLAIEKRAKEEILLDESFHKENIMVSVRQEITELVYDYYGLNARERVLIEEADKIFIPSATPASFNSKIPTLQQPTSTSRAEYTHYLCDTLNSWSAGQMYVSGRVLYTPKLGLGLLILSKSSHKAQYAEQETSDDLQAIIERIQKSLEVRNGRLSYLRGFTLFEDQKAYILKPLTLRHWTRTAALNDADTLFSAMMGMS